MCIHTHSIRSYFHCFAGTGYFFSKQSEPLLKSCSVYSEIHGFILLNESLTCSRTTGWRQLKMMLQKWSSHSPRGQKEGKDARTAYFDLFTRVFSWEKSCKLHSPLVWPGGAPAAWATQPGKQKNQNIRAEKYFEKTSSPPARMKQIQRNEVADLRVHSQLLADESLSNFPSSRMPFLLEQWFSTVAVFENHGLFFL